jgi:radical SAM protein
MFVITGGDPFQRPDLEELVRQGSELGLHVSCSPSGTPTLTSQALKRLYDAGCKAISLSIDGSNPAIHDDFRKVDGVFDLTVAAWKAAQEIGLRVQINTTLGRHNLDDLPNVAALVKQLGAMTWSGFLLVPTGRGAQLGSLTPDEVEDVLNWLYDMGDMLPTRTTEAHHFRRVVVERQILAAKGEDHVKALGLGELYRTLSAKTAELGLLEGESRRRRQPMNVNAGQGFVFISHHGEVHPSGFLPMSAGNVRETPLPEIYRHSELFTSLRDTSKLKGRCGACEFVNICGGSRSRAYAVTGDPFEEEPWCNYIPMSFPHQDAVAAMLAPSH